MKVFVETLEGTNFEIEVKPEDTVADVKKTIETAQGSDVYPSAQQMLIYQEKVLKDNTTLEENKVAENSFIVILLIKGIPEQAARPPTAGQAAIPPVQASQPVTPSAAGPNVGSNAAAGPQAHLDAPSTSNMEFRCDICGKAFDSKTKVNRHRPSHFSVPRRCEWCERILRNAGAYTNHINVCTKRPSSSVTEKGLPNVGSNAAAGPQAHLDAPSTSAPAPDPAAAHAPKSGMRPPKLECRRSSSAAAEVKNASAGTEIAAAPGSKEMETLIAPHSLDPTGTEIAAEIAAAPGSKEMETLIAPHSLDPIGTEIAAEIAAAPGSKEMETLIAPHSLDPTA